MPIVVAQVPQDSCRQAMSEAAPLPGIWAAHRSCPAITLIRGARRCIFWELNAFKPVLFPPDDVASRRGSGKVLSWGPLKMLLDLCQQLSRSRSVRMRDVIADNSSRTSEIFGLAFPNLPLPQVVQGTDGRRMQPSIDPFYSSAEDVENMRTPHIETRHLLALLVAIIRSPGQRAESFARKFRAALLLKDWINSGSRLRNLPGLAALVVGGQALPLEHGRMVLTNSVFTHCHGWAALKQWWEDVMRGSITLPLETPGYLENHVSCFVSTQRVLYVSVPTIFSMFVVSVRQALDVGRLSRLSVLPWERSFLPLLCVRKGEEAEICCGWPWRRPGSGSSQFYQSTLKTL